jgi:hypothetical protein
LFSTGVFTAALHEIQSVKIWKLPSQMLGVLLIIRKLKAKLLVVDLALGFSSNHLLQEDCNLYTSPVIFSVQDCCFSFSSLLVLSK